MTRITFFPRLTWRDLGRAAMCAGLLLAAGCHRAPRTAAELANALPKKFSGELHLQGDTESRHISIEPRDLSERSEHVLEFSHVAYQMQDPQGADTSQGEAAIRGTISVPGFAIRLEGIGADNTGGEDAIRPDTFAGTLTQDLQTLHAEWSTALGQKGQLTMQAVSP